MNSQSAPLSPEPPLRPRPWRWLPARPAEKILWFLILAGAAAVRFHGLGREGFWLDEVFSARIVEGPLGEIINRIPPDKPPLDYFIQAFFHGFGAPEVWHRFPAAICGVALVLGVYFWARSWFGRRVALVAFALTAFNPFLIYYAQEARPYSLFCALIVWQQVALGAWWRRQARPPRPPVRGDTSAWPLWLTLCLLSLLSLYALYAALLVFAAQILFLILAPRLRAPGGLGGARTSRRPFTVRSTLLFLGMLAIIGLLAWPLYSRSQLKPPEDYFWRWEPLSLQRCVRIVTEGFLLGAEGVFATISAAGILLLLGVGLRRAWKLDRAGALLLALGSVLLVPLSLFIYWRIDRAYYTRYTIYCVPGQSVLLALGLCGLARLLRPGIRSVRPFLAPRSLVFSSVVLFCALGLVLDRVNRPYHIDYRGAARHIVQQSQPGDCVVVPAMNDEIPLRYYLDHHGGQGIPILTQNEREGRPRQGPMWEVSPLYGKERRGKRFPGLTVERHGALPGPEVLARLTTTLGPNPVLWMGHCPTEIMGEGWSHPETWGPDFSIRWVTRRSTHVLIPLPQAGAGRLSISLMPYTYDGAPPQSVQPIWAGHPLERRDLPAGKFADLQWDVPEQLAQKGFNRLDLEFAQLNTPSSIKKNYGDFRSLAAAVRSIKWEARPGK